MAFKLGLVGLCTSHPARWTPIVRAVSDALSLGLEVVAAWDGGEVRPAGYAEKFCREHDISLAAQSLDELADRVDGVIIHAANWDRHLEQARPFVEAGKSVFIDKPMVGNVADARQIAAWLHAGRRLTGGSSLRFAPELKQLATALEEGENPLLTAFVGCGTDDYFYGIHAYAMAAALGPGIHAAQCLCGSPTPTALLKWRDGRQAIVHIASGHKLPLHFTAVTARGVHQGCVDSSRVYRALLEVCLPYLVGRTDDPPLPLDELLTPELSALAALQSERSGGGEVGLRDLDSAAAAYDAGAFIETYRPS